MIGTKTKKTGLFRRIAKKKIKEFIVCPEHCDRGHVLVIIETLDGPQPSLEQCEYCEGRGVLYKND